MERLKIMPMTSVIAALILTRSFNPPTQIYALLPTLSGAAASSVGMTLHTVTFTLGEDRYKAESLSLFKSFAKTKLKTEVVLRFESHGNVPSKDAGPTVQIRDKSVSLLAMDQNRHALGPTDAEGVATSVSTAYRYPVELEPGETVSVRVSWKGIPAKIGLGGTARQITYQMNRAGEAAGLEQFQAAIKDPASVIFNPINGLCDWGKVETSTSGAFVKADKVMSNQRAYFIYQYYPRER